MGLKQILSSLDVKAVEVNVHGETIQFYPVRLRALMKAQSVIADLAKAATSLFDPNEDDYTKKTITKQKMDLAEDGEEPDMQEIDATVIDAISPVHAKERIKRREQSVHEAISALLDEENLTKVAIIVEDSSRGVCEQEAFLEATPEIVTSLLRATLRANFSVFGGVVGKAMARAESALGNALDGDEEESPE